MWPVRIWQLYTCMIYIGAGLGKLNTQPWRQGNALSWCWYDEGIGRFYPDFVTEILYNRMLPIKIQTWLSLVIELLCVVTIWPMKTRRITFIVIVFLHIGIELCLLMHIFEYLSVLGWVCFFVYPNDGKSKSESCCMLENGKRDRANRTASASSSFLGSKRKKVIETIVAISLLYLLIHNIFPSTEMEKLMPHFLFKFIFIFVYPPRRVRNKLEKLTATIGIDAGPYILFAGIPPHSQRRLTAVIRFNDGKDPILWENTDWGTSSYLQREIDYWFDTYLYYLGQTGENDIPYYAAFSIHIAELYSEKKINREYSKVTIELDNTVESVSIQMHQRIGNGPPSPGLGNFESIPRTWTYFSECLYVFTPNEYTLDDQKGYLDMKSDKLRVKKGCLNRYNLADEVLHRKGNYNEGGDDTVDSDQYVTTATATATATATYNGLN